MNSLVSKALGQWGMEDAEFSLVAARENHVFKIIQGGRIQALRIHRSGLRSNAELESELAWMAELGRSGISVPAPVPTSSGDLLCELDGQQISMLSWLSGTPLGTTAQPLDHPDRSGAFRKLGGLMAQMHSVSDTWSRPADFKRVKWDRAALVGPDPLWGRFWENPRLESGQKETLQQFRDLADHALRALETDLDYGLIHADLVRENVMVDGQILHLIDFDDCGFGFRLFDIATALIKNVQEPDYPELRDALLQGYQDRRRLDMATLDLFLGLRAVTYVGWIISRLNEEGGEARNARMIVQAVAFADACLTPTPGSFLTSRLKGSP